MRRYRHLVGPALVGVVLMTTGLGLLTWAALCVIVIVVFELGHDAGWEAKTEQMRPFIDEMDKALRKIGVPVEDDDA